MEKEKQAITNGPWEWQTFDGKSVFLGTRNRGRLVVLDVMKGKLQFAKRHAQDMGGLMVNVDVNNIGDFPDANAITATPDLLAACETWLAYAEENLSEFVGDECNQEKLCPRCESGGCITNKIRELQSAIKKAKTI